MKRDYMVRKGGERTKAIRNKGEVEGDAGGGKKGRKEKGIETERMNSSCQLQHLSSLTDRKRCLHKS